MDKKLRLVLADDHALVRTGLRLVLDSQPDMQVVGEAADGEAALAVAKEQRANILLMDLSMPGLSGLDALRRVRAELPSVKVLVVTMYNNLAFVRAALAGGAAGYLLKQAVDSDLITAIRTVARGETYVYPTLAGRVLAQPEPRSAADGSVELSQREIEVLQLIALGHTNQDIASQLVVSVRTVESHKARIMQKLGLRNRAELVRYALFHDLIR